LLRPGNLLKRNDRSSIVVSPIRRRQWNPARTTIAARRIARTILLVVSSSLGRAGPRGGAGATVGGRAGAPVEVLWPPVADADGTLKVHDGWPLPEGVPPVVCGKALGIGTSPGSSTIPKG